MLASAAERAASRVKTHDTEQPTLPIYNGDLGSVLAKSRQPMAFVENTLVESYYDLVMLLIIKDSY